jgi:hypothetical protein
MMNYGTVITPSSARALLLMSKVFPVDSGDAENGVHTISDRLPIFIHPSGAKARTLLGRMDVRAEARTLQTESE